MMLPLVPIAPIALLTDFGMDDGYVAAMKGEILCRVPGAVILDLCHAIPPGDLRAGAFMLGTLMPSMPEGTIFCCVVDPGVGTARRTLCGHAGRFSFAGPDNGLATPLLDAADGHVSLHEIQAPVWRNPNPSTTFHGRDLFAPAAARLAAGDSPIEAGPRVAEPLRLESVRPRIGEDGAEATIIWIDRFGNCITTFDRNAWEAPLARRRFSLRAGSLTLKSLHSTFGEVAKGSGLIYWGSSGFLEIAVNGGSAAREGAIEPGATVFLRWIEA
jgi:S-adenosylmethionine hydrolase